MDYCAGKECVLVIVFECWGLPVAAQAGLCLTWWETPEDTFCRVVALMILLCKFNCCDESKNCCC